MGSVGTAPYPPDDGERDVRREVILPADDSAPLLARSSLNDVIPPPDLLDRADDARLAISEIAANAVRHGRLRPDQDTIRLVIEADEFRVRVEMEQATAAHGVGIVSPTPAEGLSIGGFGLRLVDQVADDWGVEPGPPGRVWFEFRG